ncbi:hypothetical protein KFK09_014860 [Dendrobium nobile]|uniref:Uncharacterized protein n=1 Tax=Dendrobium nobile TaxID=94219 RepID=A0A8T3B383_DENNO|nr:hypothetical protein KFK09_014860 [Dendrobium nobile]
MELHHIQFGYRRCVINWCNLWADHRGFHFLTLCSEQYFVLEYQMLLPVKAKEHGFHFKYPFVKDAFRDIISSGST